MLLLSSNALSQTVYKSVEGGVTSFSDQPPESGDAEAIELNVTPVSEDGLLEQRLAEMRETTDRMAADRREREQHRAELRAQQQAPEPQVVTVEQPTLVGGYWPNYGRPNRPRPPFRPGRPVKPTPLPAQPVPGWSVMQSGNSQLMRPIVSSRP
ncbi:MAG: DUF4124 domain-containing protein [Pseudomonadota bacterium]